MKKLKPLDLLHILFINALLIAMYVFNTEFVGIAFIICLLVYYNVVSIVKFTKYDGDFMLMLKNRKWKIFHIILLGTSVLWLFWNLKEIYG